jgi:hypothetical protein
MKLFYLLIIVITSYTIKAQDQVQSFFRDTYKTKVFYDDGTISNNRLDDILKILDKDTISGISGSSERKIILTTDEKAYLVTEVKKLLEVSQYDYLKNINGFTYEKKPARRKRIKEYRYISKPVFFRDDTFCIVYDEHILQSKSTGFAGTGGVGGWELYERQNGVWKHLLMLSTWILN